MIEKHGCPRKNSAPGEKEDFPLRFLYKTKLPFSPCSFSLFLLPWGKRKKRRAPHGKADSLSETVEEKAARGKPETPEHLGAAESRHPPARKPQSLQPQKSTETDGRSPFLCFFFLGKGARLLFLPPHAILVGSGHSGCPPAGSPPCVAVLFREESHLLQKKERAPCREDTFKI